MNILFWTSIKSTVQQIELLKPLLSMTHHLQVTTRQDQDSTYNDSSTRQNQDHGILCFATQINNDKKEKKNDTKQF